MQFIIDTERDRPRDFRAARAALDVLIGETKPDGASIGTVTVDMVPDTPKFVEALRAHHNIHFGEAPGDMPATDEADTLETMARDELVELAESYGLDAHRKRENTLRDMIREARAAAITDETPADDDPEPEPAQADESEDVLEDVADETPVDDDPEPEPAQADESEDVLEDVADEPQADGPTFDDAMALAKDLMAKGKAGRLKAILLGLGVEKMPGLKDDPAKIAAFVEKAQKIAQAVGDEA